MSDLMINLRRSPRKLLERDGHPGPGPGHLALILARAGVGKTAFLIDVGLDALLAGQKVLHVSLEQTIDKVRTFYDDILMELLRHEKQLEHWAAIQLDVERRRHIHTYMGGTFSIERLSEALKLLDDLMDDIDIDGQQIDPAKIEAIKSLAAEVGAELWMTCQTHREGPQAEPGHLPPPADALEDLVDLGLRLDSHGAKIRLHVLKDHKQMLDEDLHIILEPQTMLVNVGLGNA